LLHSLTNCEAILLIKRRKEERKDIGKRKAGNEREIKKNEKEKEKKRKDVERERCGPKETCILKKLPGSTHKF
jgi:hypothetical protein